MKTIRECCLAGVFVFCIGSSMAPGQIRAQERPATAEQLAAAGDQLLAKGNPAEAIKAYEQAVKLNDRFIAAYLGLAKAELEQERWHEAGNWLDKVLALDPENIDARYYRGIQYRELAKFRMLNQASHWHGAERDFEWVIARDSLHRDVLYQYALLRRYHEAYADALELAHAQIRLKPELAEPQHRIFRLYRYFIDSADPEEARTWLDDHPSDYSDYFKGILLQKAGKLDEADAAFARMLSRSLTIPVQPVLLARARAAYAQGNPDKAQRFVEEAVERITSPVGAALVFEDIKYIISDDELIAYQKITSPEEYKSFFDSFWSRRDPTPARSENVRMTEHYSRLLKAEKDYPYDGFRLWYNNPDRLGELAFPASYKLNEEFNDKGLVFIRHGEPDDRVAYTGGESEIFRSNVGESDIYAYPREQSYNQDWKPNESWRYNNPRMDFHFVIGEGGGVNNWRLAPDVLSMGMLESLEYWGPPYSEMYHAATVMEEVQQGKMQSVIQGEAFSVDESTEAERIRSDTARVEMERFNENLVGRQSRGDFDFAQNRKRMVEESREAAKLGLSTDRHSWGEKVEPLDMPHFFAAFRGKGGETKVEVHYALPIGMVTQAVGTNAASVDIEVGYAVHDTAWHTITEEGMTKRFPASPDVTTAAIDFFTFSAPADTYNVSIFSHPVLTDDVGGYREAYRAPDLGAGKFAMSDLLLADDIRPAISPSRYNRQDWHVTPNPLLRFSTRQSVFVYYEIYDLPADKEGQTKFSIEYALIPDTPRRKVFGLFGRGDQAALTLLLDRSGAEASPAEYAEIDVSNVDPGEYTLVVRVTDHVTEKTVERSRKLQLFEYK